MLKSNALKVSFALFLTSLSVAASSQEPVRNINPARHGNLAAAQSLVQQAYNAVSAAQRANEGNLGGHAARAKQLLQQANAELRLAANTANRR